MAICLALVAALAISLRVAPAFAASSVAAHTHRLGPGAHPMPTSRQLLQRLIRTMQRDATQQARHRPLAVTVDGGCCGASTVRIHHAARLRPHVLIDSYELRIKARGGLVTGLAVSEVMREAEHTTHVVQRETELEYAIERTPAAHARWHGRVGVEGIGTDIGPPGEPSMGSGAAKECSLPRVPRRVYVDMLAIVRNAKRHVSSLASGRFGGCG
jgi:hypothetical protein